MTTNYACFANLAAEANVPTDGILSRTLYNDEQVKVVLFGFAAGQELSEHTASTAVVLHFVQGEATVTLGEDKHEVGPNAWIHMQPNLTHSVHTKTPVVMLLLLLKS
jgi:quercetin dioxygenase-like cupin family protein